MIEFSQIKFKNFISYGNVWTTFNFEKGITRISGVNGQGKSTLVDAIYFVLFGKSFRKMKIPQLVNSTNKKGTCVELYFTSNNSFFKIVRGIKPDRFEIYQRDDDQFSNGDLVLQNAKRKDYQETLEEIIGCNEDVFLQIGVRSLTRHGSFLTLPKAKKRQIIEDIFGLQVISEMWDLNKIETDETEQNIRDLRRDETNGELLLEQEKANLENLKKIKKQMEKDIVAQNEKISVKISTKEETLNKLNQVNNLVKEKWDELNKVHEKCEMVENEISKIEKEMKFFTNKIDLENSKILFVQGFCPECPNIEKMKEGLDIKNAQEKYNNLKYGIDGINSLKTAEDVLNLKVQELEKVTDKRFEIRERISSNQREIDNLKSSIKEVSDAAIIVDETNYKKYKENLKSIKKSILQENENLKYNKAVYIILSDDGIKSFIIKKYLPMLNKLLNTYLQQFSIDLELEFDHELDIEIKTKFKEKYEYESFSEGEKKRIDSAMMFTFLEFCKLKQSNSGMNILILDEASYGLDAEGENIMYDILRKIVDKENKEIITISQSLMIDPEKIDRLFCVRMEKGFSRLEIAKE